MFTELRCIELVTYLSDRIVKNLSVVAPHDACEDLVVRRSLPLFAKVFVEKLGNFSEDFLGLGRCVVAQVVRVRLALEHLRAPFRARS